MDMTWKIEGESLYIGLSGRMDTLNAMDLDKKMNALPDVIKNIYFDFDGLTYITSAGLRVLFAAQEYTEDKGGKISVRNVCSQVYDIFTITGFKEFINIE